MSLYGLGRSALFCLDAEKAHALTVEMFKRAPALAALGLGRASAAPTECLGLKFRNPVGVAAGLDKNGECIDALAALGFGFVEVGTVTPKPQAGNPKPRMFRLPEHEAVINRLGFNNKGVDYLCAQVERSKRDCVLGINIGKNAATPNEQAADDYLLCLERVYPLADYITINISSPNTKNLRELQAAEQLKALLDKLTDRRESLAVQHGRQVPLALKLAPDMQAEQRSSTARAINESGIDAVIATNTTIERAAVQGHAYGAEIGGLSGRPLQALAQESFSALRAELAPRIPMIGVGGICDKSAASQRWAAGADLLQLYTGFVYHGPALLQAAVDAYLETRG